MKAIAVIGMNYGDEGKGHITNYLSDKHTLNVRFNGGAQAAHTVILDDGHSHIFHHFGSGSLKGARTLYANAFIINPILFAQEFETLSAKTVLKPIFADPRCLVTTHYDMLINTFISNFKKKQDTCGIGFNETIERSKFKQLRINVRDLFDKTPEQLKALVEQIKNEYVPYRIKELKLPMDKFKQYVFRRVTDPEHTITQYLNITKFMLEHIYMWPDDDLIDKFYQKDPVNRKIVFEGAQGLLLDKGRTKFMPFLTRSNTGLKNVFKILRTVKTPWELQTYLVTRTYLSRHGDGPIMNETNLSRTNITEDSDQENEYQGKYRYGHLDKAWYAEAIAECQKYDTEVNVAMTCLDQFKVDIDESKIKLFSYGPYEVNIKPL